MGIALRVDATRRPSGTRGECHLALRSRCTAPPIRLSTMAAMPIAPAAYPPPFAASEVIAAPEAPAEEQLEVGVAIVGGGPAGLACAIRLAQLLEDDPAVAERLGEVPIALVDKGRAVGAHQLSGAVVQPAPLRELFPGVSLEEMTSYGPVDHEAVYFLTRSRATRLPIVPPPMHNKGNHVFSLARLARFMAERAEELGVMVLPETDAQRLLVDGRRGARHPHRRQGPRRGRARSCRRSSPAPS